MVSRVFSINTKCQIPVYSIKQIDSYGSKDGKDN